MTPEERKAVILECASVAGGVVRELNHRVRSLELKVSASDAFRDKLAFDAAVKILDGILALANAIPSEADDMRGKETGNG